MMEEFQGRLHSDDFTTHSPVTRVSRLRSEFLPALICDHNHSLFRVFSVNSRRVEKRQRIMKTMYKFPRLHHAERLYIEYLLLEEVERQNWFAVVRFDLFHCEHLICIQ